jgi:hypothetical protein
MATEKGENWHEIRIKGHLGENSAVWFEEFTMENSSDGETILRGPITDQAALHGLLTRICNLGLTLTFFRKLGKEEADHGYR